MLANRRNRIHARLDPRIVTGGTSAAMSPLGVGTVRHTIARLQLRMLEELIHRVQPRVGDLSGIEPCDDLGRRDSANTSTMIAVSASR